MIHGPDVARGTLPLRAFPQADSLGYDVTNHPGDASISTHWQVNCGFES